jgi:hypothetical protein
MPYCRIVECGGISLENKELLKTWGKTYKIAGKKKYKIVGKKQKQQHKSNNFRFENWYRPGSGAAVVE